MQVNHFKVGDDVWIHVGGKGNPLVKSRVEAIIDLEGWDRHYVMSFFNSIEHELEIRSWLSISPDAEGPINMWRKAKNEL